MVPSGSENSKIGSTINDKSLANLHTVNDKSLNLEWLKFGKFAHFAKLNSFKTLSNIIFAVILVAKL